VLYGKYNFTIIAKSGNTKTNHTQSQKNMKLITVDGKQYDPANLSEEARSHLAHLAFIETELQRHQMGINVLKVSRQRIGDMLRAALPKDAGTPAAPAVADAKPAGKSGKPARK
jgi:hypothetical protein